MAHPLGDGSKPTTPYGLKSSLWKACGFHTGADWARPAGTPVYAIVDGDVRYRSYGSAFGLQLAVSPDGPGEWFYAHLSWRVPDGTRVKAGDLVGKVGSTGNSTGPHLHLEYHTVKQAWRCDIMRDPWTELQKVGETWKFPKDHPVYLSKLAYGAHNDNPDGFSDSIIALQEMLNRHPLTGGTTLPLSGKYWDMTDLEVIKCQKQHGFGEDKPGQSFVGPRQLAHLLAETKCPYAMVNDVKPAEPSWRLSAAAEKLRAEIDTLWPNRDRRTDGTIGDANHTTGEHVPDKDNGAVRALDIDADLDADPGTSWMLADLIREIGKSDKRLYYVIHDGKIASGTYPETFWTWREYDGANPHTSHIHISFKPEGDGDGTGFMLASRLADVVTTPAPEPSGDGSIRALTFNWPARYKDSGRAGDVELWRRLSMEHDVVFLQESHWMVDIVKNDPDWGIHNPRISDGKFSGESLAWRKSRFKVVDLGSTMISPYTEIQPDAAGPTLHKEKHVVWADFVDKQTGETWNFGSVHFVPSAQRLGGAARRLWEKQRGNLIAWINRQGRNCLVGGDFNFTSDAPAVEPIKREAVLRSAVSHGQRDIDWILLKRGSGYQAGAAKALRHDGESDHKPVSVTVAPKVVAPKPEPTPPPVPEPEPEPEVSPDEAIAELRELVEAMNADLIELGGRFDILVTGMRRLLEEVDS